MLFDKYAPKSWDEYVGQEKAKRTARAVLGRKGFDRAAFWIDCAGENNSGTGKTTLARLIAHEVADDLNITEVGGADVSLEWLRSMADACQYFVMGSKSCRVFIINEAHAMSDRAVDWLIAFMDRMPANLVLVFTTTRKPDQTIFGTNEGPIYSRCVLLTLTNQGLAKAFGARLAFIARAEGLDGGRPDAWFEKLIQSKKNNLRAGIQAVWSGAALSDSDSAESDAA